MSNIVGQTIHNTLWVVEIRDVQTQRWVVEYANRECAPAMKWMNAMKTALDPGQQIRARRFLSEYRKADGIPPGRKPL